MRLTLPETYRQYRGTPRLSGVGAIGLGEDAYGGEYGDDPIYTSPGPVYTPPVYAPYDPLPLTPGPTPSTTGPYQPGVNPSTPAGSGMTWAQVLNSLSGPALTAARVFQQTGSPGLIPGTQLVYNPQTGQILPASGVLTSAGQISSTLSSPLILGGIAVVLILVMSMGKK